MMPKVKGVRLVLYKMKEVFNLYLNNCYQAMIHENELIFEFNEYHYAFTFDIKEDFEEEIDEDFYSYNTLDDTSKIERLLNEIREFTSFEIKGYEYLGGREDLTEGKSITNEMFLLIKKINSFRKNVILNYYTDVIFGDPMCPDEGNYIFSIEISNEIWWNIEFAKYLIGKEIIVVEAPNFYTVFFRKYNPIRDNKTLQTITTNTKARRIGYFKILSTFLIETKKIPATSINKKFENYSLKYKIFLEENEFKKGLISETKSGISAKPYIDLAQDLGFLNKINNLFYPGKSLKVYQILQNQYSNSNNIFELSDFDKLFYLEIILKTDFFYFKCLLELLFIEENTTYSDLVKSFQNQLLFRLESFKRSNSSGERKLLNNIDATLKRIKKWEKPEVYLEHIIMPRLNWMLDLGILKGTNNRYEITNIGLRLFQHLSIWNDINTEEIISPDAFIDRFMVHLYDDCFNENQVINPEKKDIILDRVFKHIEDSFDYFKTLAPNRVTASQAANYTKYKLYLEDKIKVGYQFILEELSKKEQDKFIFKYQVQYQDGYIQKK